MIWCNDQGEQESFEWRLDLTTGQTFQGRRIRVTVSGVAGAREQANQSNVAGRINLNRSDIRTYPSNGSVSEGIQFDVTFRVTQLTQGPCMFLAGVQVDVWHCDVEGIWPVIILQDI